MEIVVVKSVAAWESRNLFALSDNGCFGHNLSY